MTKKIVNHIQMAYEDRGRRIPLLLLHGAWLSRKMWQPQIAAFSDDFRIWKQVRTGLLSHPVNMVRARAHLAQSTMLQMAVEPHIIHIVGYTEGIMLPAPTK